MFLVLTVCNLLIVEQGDLLAHPILEALCKSFYEEVKWQKSLLLNMKSDEDNEWISSVPITMVAFAATAVSEIPFLIENMFFTLHSTGARWKSGKVVRWSRGNSRPISIQGSTSVSGNM